jgi:L,D-transpeptidase catalytic domain
MNLKRPIPARYFLLTSFIFALPALFSFAIVTDKRKISFSQIHAARVPLAMDLYKSLSLDSLGLSRHAFEEAITGYLNLQKSGTIQNKGILSIVDFSIPSFRKRLFVLDMENGKLLFNTLVAHGRNSGQILATRFSNRFRSLQSSLGFYLTGETYEGKKGLALRLMGIERGINDNAFSRGIVVHAAPYVNDDISKIYGRLGRSEGCPAIPVDIHRPVIEAIKNGSCFFIYGNDKRYASRSKLLKESRVS